MEAETIDLTDPMEQLLRKTGWTIDFLQERLTKLAEVNEDKAKNKKPLGEMTLQDLLGDCACVNDILGKPIVSDVIELSDDDDNEVVRTPVVKNIEDPGGEVTEVRVVEVNSEDVANFSNEDEDDDDDLFEEYVVQGSTLDSALLDKDYGSPPVLEKEVDNHTSPVLKRPLVVDEIVDLSSDSETEDSKNSVNKNKVISDSNAGKSTIDDDLAREKIQEKSSSNENIESVDANSTENCNHKVPSSIQQTSIAIESSSIDSNQSKFVKNEDVSKGAGSKNLDISGEMGLRTDDICMQEEVNNKNSEASITSSCIEGSLINIVNDNTNTCSDEKSFTSQHESSNSCNSPGHSTQSQNIIQQDQPNISYPEIDTGELTNKVRDSKVLLDSPAPVKTNDMQLSETSKINKDMDETKENSKHQEEEEAELLEVIDQLDLPSLGNSDSTNDSINSLCFNIFSGKTTDDLPVTMESNKSIKKSISAIIKQLDTSLLDSNSSQSQVEDLISSTGFVNDHGDNFPENINEITNPAPTENRENSFPSSSQFDSSTMLLLTQLDEAIGSCDSETGIAQDKFLDISSTSRNNQSIEAKDVMKCFSNFKTNSIDETDTNKTSTFIGSLNNLDSVLNSNSIMESEIATETDILNMSTNKNEIPSPDDSNSVVLKKKINNDAGIENACVEPSAIGDNNFGVLLDETNEQSNITNEADDVMTLINPNTASETQTEENSESKETSDKCATNRNHDHVHGNFNSSGESLDIGKTFEESDGSFQVVHNTKILTNQNNGDESEITELPDDKESGSLNTSAKISYELPVISCVASENFECIEKPDNIEIYKTNDQNEGVDTQRQTSDHTRDSDNNLSVNPSENQENNDITKISISTSNISENAIFAENTDTVNLKETKSILEKTSDEDTITNCYNKKESDSVVLSDEINKELSSSDFLDVVNTAPKNLIIFVESSGTSTMEDTVSNTHNKDSSPCTILGDESKTDIFFGNTLVNRSNLTGEVNVVMEKSFHNSKFSLCQDKGDDVEKTENQLYNSASDSSNTSITTLDGMEKSRTTTESYSVDESLKNLEALTSNNDILPKQKDNSDSGALADETVKSCDSSKISVEMFNNPDTFMGAEKAQFAETSNTLIGSKDVEEPLMPTKITTLKAVANIADNNVTVETSSKTVLPKQDNVEESGIFVPPNITNKEIYYNSEEKRNYADAAGNTIDVPVVNESGVAESKENLCVAVLPDYLTKENVDANTVSETPIAAESSNTLEYASCSKFTKQNDEENSDSQTILDADIKVGTTQKSLEMLDSIDYAKNTTTVSRDSEISTVLDVAPNKEVANDENELRNVVLSENFKNKSEITHNSVEQLGLTESTDVVVNSSITEENDNSLTISSKKELICTTKANEDFDSPKLSKDSDDSTDNSNNKTDTTVAPDGSYVLNEGKVREEVLCNVLPCFDKKENVTVRSSPEKSMFMGKINVATDNLVITEGNTVEVSPEKESPLMQSNEDNCSLIMTEISNSSFVPFSKAAEPKQDSKVLLDDSNQNCATADSTVGTFDVRDVSIVADSPINQSTALERISNESNSQQHNKEESGLILLPGDTGIECSSTSQSEQKLDNNSALNKDEGVIILESDTASIVPDIEVHSKEDNCSSNVTLAEEIYSKSNAASLEETSFLKNANIVTQKTTLDSEFQNVAYVSCNEDTKVNENDGGCVALPSDTNKELTIVPNLVENDNFCSLVSSVTETSMINESGKQDVGKDFEQVALLDKSNKGTDINIPSVEKSFKINDSSTAPIETSAVAEKDNGDVEIVKEVHIQNSTSFTDKHIEDIHKETVDNPEDPSNNPNLKNRVVNTSPDVISISKEALSGVSNPSSEESSITSFEGLTANSAKSDTQDSNLCEYSESSGTSESLKNQNASSTDSSVNKQDSMSPTEPKENKVNLHDIRQQLMSQLLNLRAKKRAKAPPDTKQLYSSSTVESENLSAVQNCDKQKVIESDKSIEDESLKSNSNKEELLNLPIANNESKSLKDSNKLGENVTLNLDLPKREAVQEGSASSKYFVLQEGEEIVPKKSNDSLEKESTREETNKVISDIQNEGLQEVETSDEEVMSDLHISGDQDSLESGSDREDIFTEGFDNSEDIVNSSESMGNVLSSPRQEKVIHQNVGNDSASTSVNEEIGDFSLILDCSKIKQSSDRVIKSELSCKLENERECNAQVISEKSDIDSKVSEDCNTLNNSPDIRKEDFDDDMESKKETDCGSSTVNSEDMRKNIMLQLSNLRTKRNSGLLQNIKTNEASRSTVFEKISEGTDLLETLEPVKETSKNELNEITKAVENKGEVMINSDEAELAENLSTSSPNESKDESDISQNQNKLEFKKGDDKTVAEPDKCADLEQLRNKLMFQLTSLRTKKKMNIGIETKVIDVDSPRKSTFSEFVTDDSSSLQTFVDLTKVNQEKCNKQFEQDNVHLEKQVLSTDTADIKNESKDHTSEKQEDENIPNFLNEIRSIIRKQKTAAKGGVSTKLPNTLTDTDRKEKKEHSEKEDTCVTKGQTTFDFNPEKPVLKSDDCSGNGGNNPFVSNTLDEFLTDSKLNVSYVIPKSGAEEGLIQKYDETVVPAIVPEIKEEDGAKPKQYKYKPKTLAEKRRFLERTKKREEMKLERIKKEEELMKRSYVLYKDKKIFVNTSFMGRCIASIESTLPVSTESGKVTPRKPSLLTELFKKSVTPVKYRPGPLCKKPFLQHDFSNWTTELKPLPKVFLEIKPELGKCVHPNLMHLLPYWDGEVTDDQIDFALSTLTTRKSKPSNKIFRFKVPYENNQEEIAVRKRLTEIPTFKPVKVSKSTEVSASQEEQVAVVINNLLNYVEIKELESTLIKDDEDFEDGDSKDQTKFEMPKEDAHVAVKGSWKKRSKVSLELLRLNCKVVSVEVEESEPDKICNKPYCRLGCVCKSLKCETLIGLHCQKAKCIFGCTCPKDKSKITSIAEQSLKFPAGTDLLSTDTVTRIEDTAKRHLAKVEKEFTQTVIQTNDKTIVVGFGNKPRRATKTPKKYCDFFDDENPVLDKEAEPKKERKNPIKPCCIEIQKWNFSDIVPYCLVHHLYNCYCRGLAIPTVVKEEPSVITKEESNTLENVNNSSVVKREDVLENTATKIPFKSAKEHVKPKVSAKLTVEESFKAIIRKSANFDERPISQDDFEETFYSVTGRPQRKKKRSHEKPDFADDRPPSKKSSISEPDVSDKPERSRTPSQSSSTGRPFRNKRKTFEDDFVFEKIHSKKLSDGDSVVSDKSDLSNSPSCARALPIRRKAIRKPSDIFAHDFINNLTEADLLKAKLPVDEEDLTESELLKRILIQDRKKELENEESVKQKLKLKRVTEEEICKKNHVRKQKHEVRPENITKEIHQKPKGSSATAERVRSVFEGEIIVSDSDWLKKLGQNPKQLVDGYARILPWKALLKGFINKKINVYCICDSPLRLLLNVGRKIKSEKILDIEKYGSKILKVSVKAKWPWLMSQSENVRDIIKWLLSGTLPSRYQTACLSFLLVETTTDQFEVRGLCTQGDNKQQYVSNPTTSSNQQSSTSTEGIQQVYSSKNNIKENTEASEIDDVIEVKHKDVNNVIQSLFITKEKYDLRELVEDGYDDDMADNLYMWVGLPEVVKVAKWRVVFLNTNFTYLHFKRINYTIKLSDLVKLTEMANEEKVTLVLRNLAIKRSYPHILFGLYISHKYRDRIFLGPYFLKHEEEDIETLQYMSGTLVSSESFNEMMGNENYKCGHWMYERPYNQPPRRFLKDTIDLTCEEEVPPKKKARTLKSLISPPEVSSNSSTKSSESSSSVSSTLVRKLRATPPPTQEHTIYHNGTVIHIRNAKPRAPSEFNRFIITNIPHFGYLGAYQAENSPLLEVSWPFEKKILEFENADHARDFLQERFNQLLQPVPETFKIQVIVLMHLDLSEHEPVNSEFLSGHCVCGYFGTYNFRELDDKFCRENLKMSKAEITKLFAKRAHEYIKKKIEEIANIVGINKSDPYNYNTNAIFQKATDEIKQLENGRRLLIQEIQTRETGVVSNVKRIYELLKNLPPKERNAESKIFNEILAIRPNRFGGGVTEVVEIPDDDEESNTARGSVVPENNNAMSSTIIIDSDSPKSSEKPKRKRNSKKKDQKVQQPSPTGIRSQQFIVQPRRNLTPPDIEILKIQPDSSQQKLQSQSVLKKVIVKSTINTEIVEEFSDTESRNIDENMDDDSDHHQQEQTYQEMDTTDDQEQQNPHMCQGINLADYLDRAAEEKEEDLTEITRENQNSESIDYENALTPIYETAGGNTNNENLVNDDDLFNYMFTYESTADETDNSNVTELFISPSDMTSNFDLSTATVIASVPHDDPLADSNEGVTISVSPSNFRTPKTYSKVSKPVPPLHILPQKMSSGSSTSNVIINNQPGMPVITNVVSMSSDNDEPKLPVITEVTSMARKRKRPTKQPKLIEQEVPENQKLTGHQLVLDQERLLEPKKLNVQQKLSEQKDLSGSQQQRLLTQHKLPLIKKVVYPVKVPVSTFTSVPSSSSATDVPISVSQQGMHRKIVKIKPLITKKPPETIVRLAGNQDERKSSVAAASPAQAITSMLIQDNKVVTTKSVHIIRDTNS